MSLGLAPSWNLLVWSCLKVQLKLANSFLQVIAFYYYWSQSYWPSSLSSAATNFSSYLLFLSCSSFQSLAATIFTARSLLSIAWSVTTISGSLVPWVLKIPPKWIPKAVAASFPLGSIIPYMSSVIVKVSPSMRFAVVPLIWETGRLIFMGVVYLAH